MDSSTQPAVDGGSGGKILKRRRIAARKTPYDRHTPQLQRVNVNPNWRNAIVVSGKYVAGGSGKLISSLWNPKTWGECSASSSETESDSEGGIEEDNEQGDGAELNQNKCSSSGKSEILYLVEQLLMLDRFSREECDRIIKIVNSRLADYSMKEGVDAESNNPNISNKVIMEARKLITENPVRLLFRNYFSGGSWNIQNEVQRLHSKAIEYIKPKKLFALQAPKPGNDTVNMASKDTRTTLDNVATPTLSSLPIIKARHQSAEKKELKDDKTGDDVNRVKGNSEYAEVADVILSSEGSSNDPASTNETDSPSVKRAARIYNTKRGRPRGK
ncbi:protein KAKU4-like [Bidens hawaiensis]|uniref:protein KAKU4-like n=1 Tax=Bidens hawaiensis TaxID=980011 RepID=UPI00404B05D4